MGIIHIRLIMQRKNIKSCIRCLKKTTTTQCKYVLRKYRTFSRNVIIALLESKLTQLFIIYSRNTGF